MNAQANDRRLQNLVRQGSVSQQEAEAAHTQALTTAAAVTAAQASVKQAESALGQSGPRNAAVETAQALVRQTQLDLDRTRVEAPTSGNVASLTLRPGGAVQVGVPLFAIVSDQDYWVDSNFKETQIGRIQAGQHATVTVDAYPHHAFEGEVQSLSAGSGTAFSLLPPQNATGNWVKVTQRVPVRVRIVAPDPAFPLRIGTSAKVEVRTAG
jgi:membrane fusion protein (multidrug efflux system)